MPEFYKNWAEHAVFHNQYKKRIAVVVLGGTILSIEDPEKGRHPALTGKELTTKNPRLERLLDKRLDTLEFKPLMGKDSSDMIFEDWTTTTNKIAGLMNDYHGIVVVLGTDTADRVGTAITFGLRGKAALQGRKSYLPTPIALAASQAPLGKLQSDAEYQFEDALGAVIKASDLRVSEVMIPAAHSRLVRACRASKISEEEYDIHNSPNYRPIGRIVSRPGEDEELSGILFTRYAEYIKGMDELLRQSTLPLVQSEFASGIESIALNGTGTVNSRMALIESPSCTGLVIYTHGAGNGPFSHPEHTIVPVIESATKLGKPVLLTTSIYGGRVNPYIYEAGRVMADAGGIPTYDMTPAAAEVKLAWLMALPNFQSEGVGFIREAFEKDLVGEMGDPDQVDLVSKTT